MLKEKLIFMQFIYFIKLVMQYFNGKVFCEVNSKRELHLATDKSDYPATGDTRQLKTFR